MPEESTQSFLSDNASKVANKEFYAIGFGSNFFHPFTNAAKPLGPQLSSIQKNELKTNDTQKRLKGENTEVMESSHVGMEEIEIPNAFMFPLHFLDELDDNENIMLPDDFESNTKKNKPSAPQRIRNLMRWRRNSWKRHNEDSSKKKLNYSNSLVGQSGLDSSNSNNLLAFSFAGVTHNAMLVDGNIYMTGTFNGNIHDQMTINRPKIKEKCIQISCGKRHLLALFQNKTVMSMGTGFFGQLGHGIDKIQCKELTVIDRLSPRLIHGEVVSVEAGGMHSAAIVTKDVSTWHNRHRLKDIETKVYCWGSNKCGECAIENGKGSNVISFPTAMITVRHPETGKKVSLVKLSWGKLYCVGLSHHGHVYSWGASGRCGHGEIHVNGTIRKSALKNKNGGVITLPKRIEALRNSKVVQISAGESHTLVLSESGRVFSWGSNAYGQLGFGHTMQILSPRFVADLQFGLTTKSKEALCQEAEHYTPMKESHPSSSSNSGGDDLLSSIDLSTTIGNIHYPSTPKKIHSKKFQLQSSNSQSNNSPFINTIHATGSYSAAVSSSGDLYTWGCASGDQLGHYQIKSNPDEHVTGNGPFSQNNSSIRIQDSKSFDSRCNILIPKRVKCLRQMGMKVEAITTSPHFMIVICTKIETNETLPIGRTLFEREKQKQCDGTDRIRVVRSCGPIP